VKNILLKSKHFVRDCKNIIIVIIIIEAV